MSKKEKLNRVLLKLSGEAFAGDGSGSLDPSVIDYIAREIVDVHNAGIQTAVVVGGGNIIRGAAFGKEAGISQAVADYMGMMATIINALALQEAIEKTGVATRVMSAIAVQTVCEMFIRRRALRHLEKGRIVVLAAGTGNPFFTTDSAAALRAIELGACALLKATKVDGAYDKDPHKYADAVKFENLTFEETLHRKLGVMDQTAFTMCQENNMPIVILNLLQPGAMRCAALGENVGTWIGGTQ